MPAAAPYADFVTLRIALATTDVFAAEDPDHDTPLLLTALRARGAVAEAVVWHDDRIDLGAFDLVAIRSTWDYPERADEFAAWVARAAAATRLVNSATLVRWNLDKSYLTALADAGIPTVPTAYCRDLDDARAALRAHAAAEVDARTPRSRRSARTADAGGPQRIVVKPTLSAGARDTGLFDADDPRALALAERIIARGGTAMIQPEIAELSAGAEKALYVIEGRFTHAIAKGALLEVGGELRGGVYQENPIPVPASLAEQTFAIDAVRAVSHITGEPMPLYARVDVIDTAAHGLIVLEVELIEPALNLHVAPEAIVPVADALLHAAG